MIRSENLRSGYIQDDVDEYLYTLLPEWNGSLPASFFYAKDGRQIGQFIGERTRDAYETAIRSLLTSGSH